MGLKKTMAYTEKDRAYQKKRYRTDKKYREKLIKDNTEKHKKSKTQKGSA